MGEPVVDLTSDNAKYQFNPKDWYLVLLGSLVTGLQLVSRLLNLGGERLHSEDTVSLTT